MLAAMNVLIVLDSRLDWEPQGLIALTVQGCTRAHTIMCQIWIMIV